MSRLRSLVLAAALVAPGRAPLAAQQPAAAGPAVGTPDVRDLPLVEVAPAAAASAPAARSVAILLTGDGDWAPLDRGVAGALAAGGVPVVGLKSRAYLEHGTRTPDGLARDVERIARYAMARWGRDQLVLLGYSRGADFVPLAVNRIAPDLRERVALVGLYGAEQAANFEFHLVDLIADRKRASDIPIAPELARMLARPGLRAFCVYGADEKDSACRAADASGLHKFERGGAHHFDKDYPGLGRLALDELNGQGAGRAPGRQGPGR